MNINKAIVKIKEDNNVHLIEINLHFNYNMINMNFK